jgi:large subunit ribosomal protein L13
MVAIDGRGAVLGRLSTHIAKRLIMGEKVELYNAEKLVVSGDLQTVAGRLISRRWAKDKKNPENSMHWPRVPRMLVRRIIRGMLPWHSSRGRVAYRNLRVFEGDAPAGAHVANEFSGENLQKSVTIADVCRQLGWQGN